MPTIDNTPDPNQAPGGGNTPLVAVIVSNVINTHGWGLIVANLAALAFVLGYDLLVQFRVSRR